MLRPLGRGIAHRYRLSQHVHVKGLVRTTFVASNSASLSKVTIHLSRRTTYPYPQPLLLSARSLSTPPSTTTKSKDASTTHTILPIPPKHKVELRPGPVKPPIAPSNPHSPKLKELSSTNTSPQLQSTSSTAKSSETISETMREDMKYAYIHGILARPPPNAGKLARLWHQAKELFRSQVNYHASQAGQRDPSTGKGRWRTSVPLGISVYSNQQE
ncbi:hypothetical protein BGW80DRAFT_708454 [Lactifluus volemus]|nr:hypothetical protein BGW80DRAFT_708454 [Lactifluus volemus]